jgi:hypothetical protein
VAVVPRVAPFAVAAVAVAPHDAPVALLLLLLPLLLARCVVKLAVTTAHVAIAPRRRNAKILQRNADLLHHGQQRLRINVADINGAMARQRLGQRVKRSRHAGQNVTGQRCKRVDRLTRLPLAAVHGGSRRRPCQRAPACQGRDLVTCRPDGVDAPAATMLDTTSTSHCGRRRWAWAFVRGRPLQHQYTISGWGF